MGLVEITRNTTTIAVLPGVNQGEIRVLFPEAVNVSGGNLIVVCFSLDFGDILLQEQAIEIVLTLDVEDNNTCELYIIVAKLHSFMFDNIMLSVIVRIKTQF